MFTVELPRKGFKADMIISKTLDYAVRAVMMLAENEGEPVVMKAISKTRMVPLSYLSKVLQLLVKAELVASVPGPQGGYTLNRSPADISLYDLFAAVHGEFRILDCQDKEGVCVLIDTCAQVSVWRELESIMESYLRGMTLAGVVRDRGVVLSGVVSRPASEVT